MKQNIEQALNQFNDAIDNLKLVIGKSVECVSKAEELAPGTIVKLKNGDYTFILNLHSKETKRYSLDNGSYFYVNEFEVITPIEGPAQVGDKIITTFDGSLNYKVGEVHEVIDLDGSHDVPRAVINRDGEFLYLLENSYKIISRPDPRTQCPELQKRRETFENAGRELDEFKEGDVGKHPECPEFTYISEFDLGRNGTYFSSLDEYVDLSKVIPVCFAEDRLDK